MATLVDNMVMALDPVAFAMNGLALHRALYYPGALVLLVSPCPSGIWSPPASLVAGRAAEGGGGVVRRHSLGPGTPQLPGEDRPANRPR